MSESETQAAFQLLLYIYIQKKVTNTTTFHKYTLTNTSNKEIDIFIKLKKTFLLLFFNVGFFSSKREL